MPVSRKFPTRLSSTVRPLAGIAPMLALALPLIAAAPAQAQDTPDSQWHGDYSLGGSLAAGNSTARTVSSTGATSRATAQDKISLYGNVNYGRNRVDGTQTTTADQARLGGRYDFNLGSNLFAFGGSEVETNKVAGLKSRFDLNAGLGYKLFRDANNTLDLFGGAGWSDQRRTDGTSGSGAELMVGEESTHKLSSSTSLKQRLEFRPGQKEIGNLATFDAGLATAISGGWTLNTGLQVRHATNPGVDIKPTDTLLTMGFGYKF